MIGMFGPRLNTVFRSKWRAVWFALSVLLGAWLSIPHHSATDDPNAQNDADADAVASLLQQQPPAQPDHHVNPWAKTPPQQGR